MCPSPSTHPVPDTTSVAPPPAVPATRQQRRPPKYVTQQDAAKHFGVHPRTIRNWIARGLITGFRLPGARAIRVNLIEVEHMLMIVPTTTARTPSKAFGPRARIVNVAQVVEPVTPEIVEP